MIGVPFLSRPAKKKRLKPESQPYAELGQGRLHRGDPVHGRFNYDTHRRAHPLERIATLRRQLNSALEEIELQAGKSLRGLSEQSSYEFAMQAAATHASEINSALVFLLAVLMQEHPSPWKLTPYERS